MIARKNRSARGAYRQEAFAIAALAGICYYGYQYLAIYQAPSQLVGKDFICGDGAFSTRHRSHISYVVWGCQNPKLLVEYTHKSNLQARLQAPTQALQNEADRNQIMLSHQLVNLANDAANTPMSEMYNPLVVHVLDTDSSAKDVPLLVVRPVNKSHKGETWYITAKSINPAANVTGFANVAAKTHKFGLLDVLENKEVQKAIKAANK